jgi:hypothetical protein
VQFKRAKLLKICKYLVDDDVFSASLEELRGFASLSLLDVELDGFLSADDDVLDGSLLADLKLKWKCFWSKLCNLKKQSY